MSTEFKKTKFIFILPYLIPHLQRRKTSNETNNSDNSNKDTVIINMPLNINNTENNYSIFVPSPVHWN